MSFEDDEYWEAEYHDKAALSYADDGAAARDPYAVRRPAPPAEPMPTRRPASARADWDGDFDEPPAPGSGVDELAARRQRRGNGNSRPPVPQRRPQVAFDSQRPGWLDDPDFVPPDVSGPDLAGSEFSVLDFNRPELGADFDAPEFGISSASAPRRAAARPSRGAARSLEEQFAAGELDYGDLEYDEEDYYRDLDQARGGRSMDDSGRVVRVRRDDSPERDRSRPAPADDDGYGATIRPPGGRRPRRTAEPGRYAPGQEPREGDRPRFAEPTATGRARIPEPVADFNFDDLRTVSGRASVDSDVAGQDEALDIYRPRRGVPDTAGPGRAGPLDDEFYREPLGNRPYRGEAARSDSRADEALDEESRRADRRPAARAETDPRTAPSRSGELATGDSWGDDRREIESWTADLRDDDNRPFGDRRPTADFDDPDRGRTPAPSSDGDRAHRRPDADLDRGPAGDLDRRPAADLDRGQRGADEIGRADAAGVSAASDADQPRVVSSSAAPTTPRVIHKATPPATPKVLRKADPPATPKVIKKVEPTAPARVVKPAPPNIPAAPAAAAGSASVPVAPNPAEVVRPRSAPPTTSPPTTSPPTTSPQTAAAQGRPEPAAPTSSAGGAARPNFAGPDAAERGVARPDFAGQSFTAPNDESSWVTAERPTVPGPQDMRPTASPNGHRQAPGYPQAGEPQNGQWQAPSHPQAIPPAAGDHQPPIGQWQPLDNRQAPVRPQAMPPAPSNNPPPDGGRQAPSQPPAMPPAAAGDGFSDDESWQRIGRPGAPRLQGIPSDAAFPPATAPQHGVRFRPGVRPTPGQRPVSPAATGTRPAADQAPTPSQARPAAAQTPMAPPASGTRPASGPPATAGVAAAHQEQALRLGGWLPEGQLPASQSAPPAQAPIVTTPQRLPDQRTQATRRPGTAPNQNPQAPQPPVSPATAPHAMPTGQLPAQRSVPQPRAAAPVATPPQVHPRVEPTPINGYPGSDPDRPGGAPYVPISSPPARPATQHRAPTAATQVPVVAPTTGPPAPAPATPSRAQGPAAGPAAVDPDPAPIGRLRTSGPDTAPRQYSDAGLGAWFSAKPSADGETDESGTPNPTAAKNTVDGNATANTMTGTHAESDGTESNPPAGPKAGAQALAGEQTRPAGAAPEAAAAEAAATMNGGTADESGSGVVLDFDITGLLNGTGITAEQPISVSRHAPSSPDRASAPAELDVRRADPPGTPQTQPPSAPSPEPTEPQVPVPALKPLAAADLEAIRWRLDGGTLREVVDDRDALRELGARLDEPLAGEADNISRSGLLSVRAEVYRLLDELGMAAAASRLALSHAESAGDVQSIVIAQAELAHVLRLRGDFGEADRLFEEAASSDSPEVLRSIVHENAGRSCFDQGRHMEALDHFARAIRLGRPDDLDLVERIGVSLESVYIHVLRDGWGPYPRLRRDIIDPPRRGATPQPPAER